MTTHAIRLRGGWEIAGQRIALPAVGSELPLTALFRLVRRFGKPPLDGDAETLVLTFADVPGLVRVRLNGQDVELRSEGEVQALDGPFLPRNVLELEADLSRLSEAELARPWGSIALEARPSR